MPSSISVSAPGKLMLLGEHAVVYNRPCIVTAVGQRMHVAIEKLDDPVFQLDAPDVGVENYEKPMDQLGTGELPKGARFVEVATSRVYKDGGMPGGIKITTRSEFSSEYGFGSSSASAVCTVKAISELYDLDLPEKSIFKYCFETVQQVQGGGSGFDIAASLYGGTLYFLTGGKTIEPLSIQSLPLVIGYTGVKVDTMEIVREVKDLAERDPDLVEGVYNQVSELVDAAKDEITSGNFEELGKLMNFNQSLLNDLGVSSPLLDEMIKGARDAGAYGAKLSGAGKGDCMIALVPEEKRSEVALAIESAGGQVIDVPVNVLGVTIE